MIKKCFTTLILLSAFCPIAFCQQLPSYDTILAQMRFSLKKELLEVYYPAIIDQQYGGYLSNFTYDFKPAQNQDKMIVTQSRHLWTTSRACLRYRDTAYLRMATHGYQFLHDKMWDKQNGGFINLVARDGSPKSQRKEAYGNAFAIYALAAYYNASKDSAALKLAIEAFRWLEKNSHDPKHLGYFQHLEVSGKPIKRPAGEPGSSDLGLKDQNSSIHLLEAFTELYQVWKDPLLKTRLQEMLVLIRDKMVQPKGYLQLFFQTDWMPVSFQNAPRDTIIRNRYIDHVSFGHDVETAYLMMEAEHVLGNRLTPASPTMITGKKMVDHALKNGWDNKLGGFYDQGYYFKNTDSCTILKNSKNWWTQAEALNTLLIFSRTYPRDAAYDYGDKFRQLWQYTWNYLIDHEHGDWYEEGLDNDPQRKTMPKSHIWKATYHNYRALESCINQMENKNTGY